MKQMGAVIKDGKNKIEFRVFAHNRKQVNLCFKTDNGIVQYHPMHREEPHIFSTVVNHNGESFLYKFQLDEEGVFPDPYTNYQPEGVHGFSEVIDHNHYRWKCREWKGINLETSVIYEMHIGTFTREGTFRAATEKLNYLAELGINAVELMPVTQNPGRWNWGYDGANLFSVNHNYGTPHDLKYFIDCCHLKGISVILDVVYNHLGPEGNYLSLYGPYFTHKHETPWGAAVNFDDEYNEVVRGMVLDNVSYWIKNYRLDALRLDAVHAIKDNSHNHILEDIGETADRLSAELNRKIAVIAETDENDVKLINPRDKGGYGLDAQWMDDFHHCVHTVLTGEEDGYYKDYGRIKDFEKVYHNYIFTGQHSLFWHKPRGTDASANPGRQFVVAVQTHDQVGNRATGDRLTALVDFPYLKAAAGLLFFTPYVPMLFMGEEYAEQKPFLFFTDYIDPALKKAVSEGRKKEFAGFNWNTFPDPEDDETFYKSALTTREEWRPENKYIFSFYRDLIKFRKTHPALNKPDKNHLTVKVNEKNKLVEIIRRSANQQITGVFNLGRDEIILNNYYGKQILNSEWKQYGGETEKESKVLQKGQMIVFDNEPGDGRLCDKFKQAEVEDGKIQSNAE